MSFEHATVDTNLTPTVRVTFGVIGISTSFLLLPLAIFYVYHYHRLRRSNILKKRYVSLGVTSSILMIIWVSTATQFYFIQNMFGHLISPMASTIIKACYVFVYPYTSHCALWLMLTRFWLTYFDFSWTKATLNSEWKCHIDPQGSSKNEQWFLKNKAKYGNLQFIRRKAWIISLCISTFSMIAFEFSVFTTLATAGQIQMLDFIFYIVPTITLLILWKKTPPVYDILFYRQEMKKLGFTVLACLINYFGVIAVGLILKDDVITTFYGGMSQLFYAYSLILYQTMWVLYKIKHANMNMGRTYNRENSHSLQSHSVETGPSLFRMFSLTSNKKHREREKAAAAMLPLVLNNKHAFNLFMQHLSTEFCMEMLLAFTELTQYRMMLEQDVTFMANVEKNEFIGITENGKQTNSNKNGANIEMEKHKNIINTPAGNDDDNVEIALAEIWNETAEEDHDNNGVHGQGGHIRLNDDATPITPRTPTTPKTPTTPNQIMTAVNFSAVPNTSLRSTQSKRHVYKSVKLPKKIPQSYIVYKDRINMNGNEKYLEIVIDLYKKYVKIGSEFEINVSYGMRYGVQRMIENSDGSDGIECDLYDLFESCRRELYVLMTHSCQRFVDTDKYKLIENELLTVKKE